MREEDPAMGLRVLTASTVLVIAMALAPAVSRATSLDLNDAGDFGVIDGVFFTLVQPPDETTGTGRFDPFVRIDAGGGDPQLSAGYNTTGTLEFDTKAGALAVQIQDLPMTTLGGITYYEFLLDSNEPSHTADLTIDDIQIFLGSVGNLSGYGNVFDSSVNVLPGALLTYHMDATGDHSVTFDANFHGSGRGELQVLIPTTLVSGSDTDFVYFYSEFSLEGDGFEEWGTRGDGDVPPPPVPEPSTALMLGLGLAGLARFGRPRAA
jgi:hypothetical protein